jgi:signal transduction histidine kinase
MFGRLKKIVDSLKNLQYLGVSKRTELVYPVYANRTILINRISLIMFINALPYYFIFNYCQLHVEKWGVIGACFIYSFVLILNKEGKLEAASYHAFFGLLLIVSFFTISIDFYAGAHLMFFPLVIMPFFILENKTQRHQLRFSIIAFLISVLVVMIKFLFFNTVDNPMHYNNTIYFFAMITVFLLIVPMAYVFHNSVVQANKLMIAAEKREEESKRREHEAHDQALFGKIIRGIGHEIKNPLAGLKLWSDMLSKSLDDPEIVKKASQVFENNINRLTQRTAIMLKYTGSQKYVLQLFNLNTILNDLVLLFDHNFKQHDINFEFETMPQIDVYGSEDLLQSALCNVMLNALQFTPRNGTIRLSAKYSNYRDPDDTLRDGVEIAISDTGPGISQDQLTEIFKPFITSHAQSENAGLGLAEVKKAMTYMYGGVDVFSELGKGSRFMLYIPVKEPMKDGKPLITTSTDTSLDF